MPRPPKNKVTEVAPSPVPVAPVIINPVQQLPVAQVPGGPPVIDVAQFIRVRDSVYNRLQTIQDLIRSFSADYLRQTNLLIGEGTSLENGQEALDHLNGAALGLIPNAFAPPVPAVEEKKERKKRTHDPNAPKRPLTPYFLYMQTARPIIASDLGEQAPKGAVQEEGQRRWAVMAPGEKAGWNQAYKYNLRLYNARVHSYKAGNLDAKGMTDEEARQYADLYNINVSPIDQAEEFPADEQDAIAEQLHQTAAVESPAAEASEEEPAPPAKTPKKTVTRKRKSTAATPAVEPPKPEPAATPASPEAKKRKRTSKAAEIVEEPKKSARKKTKN
ncbi:hypothetical protein QBC40DRAFT_212211 [Triangularia verruculosa]|uniref:HMG box domain-containing protein n=1 Tax=Triangularia verruculosa TaxID=2587418 RepID=A0AAN6X6Z1_9PEZI|nr:hypothetical protein QBC40DRAFT_212211 [Triangularia verruculosa]